MFYVPPSQPVVGWLHGWEFCTIEAKLRLQPEFSSIDPSGGSLQDRHSVARISEESQQVGAASSPFPVSFLTFFFSVCDNFIEKMEQTKHYNAAYRLIKGHFSGAAYECVTYKSEQGFKFLIVASLQHH